MSLIGRIDSAVLDAVSTEVGAFGEKVAGRKLPQLAWFMERGAGDVTLRGLADGFGNHWEPDQVREALREWADALALTVRPPLPGTIGYGGTVEGNVAVEVWGVVDSAAWKACLDVPALGGGR